MVPTLDSESDIQARVAQAAADYLTTAPAGASHSGRQLGSHPARSGVAAAAWLGGRGEPGADQRQRQQHSAGGRCGGHRRDHRAQSAWAARPSCRARQSSSRLPPGGRSNPIVRCRACWRSRRVANAYLFSAGVVDQSSVHVDSGYLTRQSRGARRSRCSGRRRRTFHHRGRNGRRRRTRRSHARTSHLTNFARLQSALR